MKFLIMIITFSAFSKISIPKIPTGTTLGIFYGDSKSHFSYGNDKEYIPASTFKIFSAYYILKKLGPNFKLETRVGTNGDDLIFQADSDPYLLTPDVIDMANAIKSSGIKSIKGNLVIDAFDFPPIERIDYVGLDDQSYNQSLSPLVIDFNRFKAVKTKQGLTNFPKIREFEFHRTNKKLEPGLEFKNIEALNWAYSNVSSWYNEVPLRNSLQFNAYYIKSIFEKQGISIKGELKFKKATIKKLIYQKHSLPISRLVELAMEYSNNLFMEVLLLKASGARSLVEASMTMRQDLHKRFPSLDLNKVNFQNASGLSTKIKLKPWQLASFIAVTARERFSSKSFQTYLTLAGSGGFLAKRFLDDKTYNMFFAKTGSLDYVNTMCGISVAPRPMSFCIFLNDIKRRDLLDGKNNKRAQALRKEAKYWNHQTDKVIEEVITKLLSTDPRQF